MGGPGHGPTIMGIDVVMVGSILSAIATFAVLVAIYAALAGQSVADVLGEYAGQGFGAFKPKLADLAVSVMGPIGAEMRRLMADPAEIDRILAAGGERCRDAAAPTMAEVRRIVGFLGG